MTTYQLSLDLSPLTEPDYEPHLTVGERFDLFHAANPHVADTLEALAAQWLVRHNRVGMKALYEQARWETGIQTTGDVWRLNNDFTSRYARLLIDRRPEWATCIQTRELRAA
jgi:hypothetical protein